MKKYRVGIIGLGRQASLFEEDPLAQKPCSHAGAYTAFPKTEIVSACDIRQDRRDRFSKTWGVKSLYKDYKKMLKNEKLDIVSICTHSPLHREMTLAAAKAGVAAIFCEKPMATTLKEAEEMIDVCQKNNVILVVGYTRRWDPTFKKVKEIIVDKKGLGEIKSVVGYCTAGLLNGASHLIDLLRFFNGEVDWVFANLKRDKSTEPSGTGFLKFKNGSYGFLHSVFGKYVFFEITVTGTKGMVRGGGMLRGGQNFALYEVKPSVSESGLFELFPSKLPKTKEERPLLAAVRDIVECLETGKKPLCAGQDGKAAMEIAFAFHKSDQLKSKVALPLKDKKLRVIPRETSFTESGKLPN